MEILVPGLILVALMVYASTRIKKRAAEAFESELIETDAYSIQKPEGFLHVIDSPKHDFEAYSKESGDEAGARRATIEVDAVPGTNVDAACETIRASAHEYSVRSEDTAARVIETEEATNESDVRAFYKLVRSSNAVYRLRFAVISKHSEEYLRRINETLESFVVKTN